MARKRTQTKPEEQAEEFYTGDPVVGRTPKAQAEWDAEREAEAEAARAAEAARQGEPGVPGAGKTGDLG